MNQEKKLALTRERIKYSHLIGIGELELKDFMDKKEILYIHQKAILTFNVDFLVGNTIIELTTTMSRNNVKPKIVERNYLLNDMGYRVIAIEFKHLVIFENLMDQIMDFIIKTDKHDSKSVVIKCGRFTTKTLRNKHGQFECIPINHTYHFKVINMID